MRSWRKKDETKNFAEDKPNQKVFDYQLELDSDTILKATTLICGTVAAVSLLSLFKEK